MMKVFDLRNHQLRIGSYVYVIRRNTNGIVTRIVFTKMGTRITVQYGAYPALFYRAFRREDNKKGFNVVFVRET